MDRSVCSVPGISRPFDVKDNTQPLRAIPDNWLPRRPEPAMA